MKKNLRGLDFNPVRSGLLLVMLVALLTGCGMLGDPILDNLYTKNVYPGTANEYSVGSEDLPYSEGWFNEGNFEDIYVTGVSSLNDVAISGETTFSDQIRLEDDGIAWLEFRPALDFDIVKKNAVPLSAERGVFSGFELPIWAADFQELYFDICIPNRWDGESDIDVHFDIWLDTAQDAANDSFRLQLAWENRGPAAGVVPNAPVVVEAETIAGVCPQYQCFQVTLQIDYDGGARTIENDDNLALRLRRVAVVGGVEIDGLIVIDHVGVIFRCDKLGSPIP